MKAHKKTITIRTVTAGLCLLALTFGVTLSPSRAQEAPGQEKADYTTGGITQISAPANPNSVSKAKNYFVEFRSRSAQSYGHTFLVHGKLNAQGQIGKVSKGQVAGLHPISESPVPWMIGHLVPVVAERGWSDGDDEDQYVTAAYRVTMTEQEYARVSAFIRKHQKDSPMWHAVLYNCNAWVGDVAKFMGLKAPDNTLAYPADYITNLASLNGGTITKPYLTAQKKPAGAKPATAAKPAAPKPAASATATAKPAAATDPAAKPADPAATPAAADAAAKPATAATDSSTPKPAAAAKPKPATPKPTAAQTPAQTTAAVPIPFPERY